MSSPAPTPKVVKPASPPRSNDAGPTIWHKILERKFLFIAIVLHVLLAIGATYVVISDTTVTRKKFMPPAGSAEAAKKGAEHKVSLGRKQSTMSAPEQAKRVVTNSAFAKVALPEMPEMPTASTDVFANRAIGLGGAGSAFGATGSPGGGGGGGGSGINFFGLRTRAKSIVFLVDVSDSMVMPLNRTQATGPTAATASTLKKAEKGPQTYLALEREIARGIRSLDKGMTFSLVAFAGDVEPYKETLVPANDLEKERAIKWLMARNPGLNVVAERRNEERASAGFEKAKPGAATSVTKFNHAGTKSLAALKYAFAMNPDAICFVSDGVPTDGGYQAAEVLPAVQAMQKQLPRPSVVNVVAFLADGGFQFMQDLATQNQGSFKEIKPGMTSFGF
jgi:hypothetical protein